MEAHLQDGRRQAIAFLPADWREHAGAPASGTALCRLDDIEPGAARVFTFGGGTARFQMFILRWAGNTHAPAGLYAYANDCPHARGPLDWKPAQFLNKERTLIQCANHGARFRIADGICVHGPCPSASLTRVPIEVADGEIRVGSD